MTLETRPIDPDATDDCTTPALERFTALVAEWRRDTRFSSSVDDKVAHHAYLAIVGMGPAALPFIFQDLQRTRDHWLVALHAITLEDPAPPGATFGEAVDAWLSWDRQRGYLDRRRST